MSRAVQAMELNILGQNPAPYSRNYIFFKALDGFTSVTTVCASFTSGTKPHSYNRSSSHA